MTNHKFLTEAGVDGFFREAILNGPDYFAAVALRGAKERLVPGSGTQPAAGWVRAAAQYLMQWHAEQGTVPSSAALELNAYALSLVSPDTGQIKVPSDLKGQLGLPEHKVLSKFLECAGREAAAAILKHAGEHMPDVLDRLKQGEWAISENGLAIASNLGRATVHDYRSRADYLALVLPPVGWALLAGEWSNYATPSRGQIRSAVSGMTAEAAIAMAEYVQEYPKPVPSRTTPPLIA